MPDDSRAGTPMLPPGFTFGTASSAATVEGAADADGRGPSIWDTFTERHGHGDALTGDHYHHVAEDVALLQRLGVQGHRFSVSWSRVQPDGRGAVNEAGLDFYDRYVDTLLAAGVEPMATLYQWDLPQALEDDGGWLNPETVDRFAEYARVVADRLADRVAHWVPLGSPNVQALQGYGTGAHAPGRALQLGAVYAAHRMLLAHGRAVTVLRAAGAASVGCSNQHAPVWPASDDAADVGASKLVDTLYNGLFLEPMLLGRYPTDIEVLLDDVVEPGDLATIRQPLDFYGVAFYRPLRAVASPPEADLPFELVEPLGHPLTDAGWAVVPEALREWLIMFRARYRAALPPLVVTECGAALEGPPEAPLDDQARIGFLADHLRAVAEAVQRGVDVRGFYAWTLLDGRSWAGEHPTRFGLVHVDADTGARTPKASFGWYADLIAAQPRSRG